MSADGIFQRGALDFRFIYFPGLFRQGFGVFAFKDGVFVLQDVVFPEKANVGGKISLTVVVFL
ncbi:MAG: hypothetical protein ACO1NO_03345 [Burkholderiaceae bacterium]